MQTVLLPIRGLSRKGYTLNRWLSALALAFSLTFVFAAEKKTYDLPSDAAEKSLRRFSAQSGVQVIFRTEVAQGERTREVKGEFTAADAINQMLAGTNLLAVRDEKTGALTVNRLSAEEKNAASRRAASPAASEAIAKTNKVEDGAVKLEEYEVTGSRIRSILGEATIQPVYTFTSEDLQRFGVQQMSDLNAYVPQLPTIAWESSIETGYVNLANQGGRTNFNGGLRNLGNTATLLLVNGRRVPKLGTASGADSYDFGGIPMSSIERVEVLTDGASAIYGADAAAGVINVILKKNYQGSELSLTYGNTFKSDTGYRQAQLTTAFSKDGLSLNVSGSWARTNAFAPRDRWFLASNDKRAFGGADGRGTVPGGTGIVRNSIVTENLPGLNSPEAAIPAGSLGVNLTVANFANAGPAAPPYDSPQYQVYGDRELKTVRVAADYEIKSWLTPFVEATWSEELSFRPGVPRTVAVNLPAGYPGNPFGVPISVRRVYWEMAQYEDTTIKTVTKNVLVGVRGRLRHDWRYEGGIQRQNVEYSATGVGASGSFGGSTPLQAAVNAGLQPILLNDGTRNSPNSPELLRSFMAFRDYGENPTLWTYDLRADGPVWSLPAGDIQVAAGAERQEEYAKFTVMPNDILGRLKSAPSRQSVGLFTEVSVPLASEKKRFPLAYRLSVNVSARRDDYSDFGAKTVPRYGVLWSPVKFVALRASYGEGYKVPTLSQAYAPTTVGNVGIGSGANVFDPKRGGENVFVNVVPPGTTYTVSQISGGTSGLRPELSENINLGLLLDVPFVKGLSFGADFYDIDQTDRIGGGLVNVVANFEERITRLPATTADIARGYAGLITAVDVRAINIASYRVTGWDYQMRYSRRIEKWGDFNLRVLVSKPKSGEQRAAPNAPPVPNTPGSSYWRGTAYLYWSKNAWSAGVTANYTSSYLGRYFPGGSYFNNRITNDEYTVWDANLGYDFGHGQWKPEGWRRHIFADLRMNFNVYNVKNQEPQLDPVSKSALGTLDPRGRRYQVALIKKF